VLRSLPFAFGESPRGDSPFKISDPPLTKASSFSLRFSFLSPCCGEAFNGAEGGGPLKSGVVQLFELPPAFGVHEHISHIRDKSRSCEEDGPHGLSLDQDAGRVCVRSRPVAQHLSMWTALDKTAASAAPRR
jgi:hypothetical protein